MMKSIVIGVWACLITLAASYETSSMRIARANHPVDAAVSASEARKTKEINVPIVRQGAVKGYVVVQFTYVVNLGVAKATSIPPDAFVVDEAFRYLYDDESIDFSHLEKLDLGKMTRTLVQKVNARMKAEILTDIAVQECTFVASAEAKTRL
jgi:hypothetical protein